LQTVQILQSDRSMEVSKKTQHSGNDEYLSQNQVIGKIAVTKYTRGCVCVNYR